MMLPSLNRDGINVYTICDIMCTHMDKIGIRDLRQSLSGILREKREVAVTKNGKEIAYIVYTIPRGDSKKSTGKIKNDKMCTHGFMKGLCKYGC